MQSEPNSAQQRMFSVITPAYNAEATIGHTLESIRAQSCSAWEAIVVDDGSEDRTFVVASEMATLDDRIRVIRQRNAGTAAARNAAVSVASGDWVCLLDADDMLESNYLQAQSDFISAHPGYGVYSCNADALLPDGSRVPVGRTSAHDQVVSFGLMEMLEVNLIGVWSVVKRQVFDDVGGFRDGVYVEDYDFWLRALARGVRHIHNPQTLVLYRISPTQKSADATKTMLGIREAQDHLVATERVDRSVAKRIRKARSRDRITILGWELHDSLRAGDFAGGLRRYVYHRYDWVRQAILLMHRVAAPLLRLWRRLAHRDQDD